MKQNKIKPGKAEQQLFGIKTLKCEGSENEISFHKCISDLRGTLSREMPQ